jgi:hypothetical protein
MLSDASRRRFMVGTPIAFAVLLTALHPISGSSFYDAIAANEPAGSPSTWPASCSSRPWS